jgi:hypothetical protein
VFVPHSVALAFTAAAMPELGAYNPAGKTNLLPTGAGASTLPDARRVIRKIDRRKTRSRGVKNEGHLLDLNGNISERDSAISGDHYRKAKPLDRLLNGKP